MKNRQIQLASRPEGEPKLTDFRLAESEAPAPKDGEVLLRRSGFRSIPTCAGA